jgi:hypothetical protein
VVCLNDPGSDTLRTTFKINPFNVRSLVFIENFLKDYLNSRYEGRACFGD